MTHHLGEGLALASEAAIMLQGRIAATDRDADLVSGGGFDTSAYAQAYAERYRCTSCRRASIERTPRTPAMSDVTFKTPGLADTWRIARKDLLIEACTRSAFLAAAVFALLSVAIF